MKKLILGVTLLVAFSVHLQAQDMPKKEEMMKSWQVYMTPGEVHKMVSKFDGVWTEDVTMMMNPSTAPTKGMLKATNRMIFGGRYQESKHSGTMDGKPFEGFSTLGYDNSKKVFQSTWIDNMGTGTMFLEGMWDESTKTIRYKGKCMDPMSGQELDVREDYVIVDDNNHKLTMYMTMPGQPEMKTMEIAMKRIGK